MGEAAKEPVKIVTQNFGKEEARDIAGYEKLGGYQNLRKALKMEPKQIIEEVTRANLCGRGGAGFPAGKKWQFLPKDAETVYLVVNADEGEPGTYKDRWLMHWDPHRLIEGICITSFAIRAHMAEFGVVARVGLPQVKELLAVIADPDDAR